jgi:glucan phosphoethanolaminetransferase (alkaline phosphatase superfamily)
VSAFVFPAVLVFVFGVYSFTKPLQALFFSLIALIINAAYKATFRYAQLFNISVYAMVPSTCAAVLAEYFGIRLGFFWFLYSAFYVLFLVLGIQAAKETAPQPQPPQG